MKALRTWAEVDLAALRHNAEIARSLAGDRRIMAVVKADAYGHGVIPIARCLQGSVDMLGVSGLQEAREIREAGVRCPIYLLGASLEVELPGIIDLEGLVLTLSSMQEARALSREADRRGRCIPVHVAIDTGMGRIGFRPEEWGKALVEELEALPGLKLTGLMSHLPSADEDERFTRQQFRQFTELSELLPGLDFHIANSAGLIGYGEEQIGNLIRLGLLFYGCSPIDTSNLDLRPVMSLKSRVTLVRELPAGSSISYGRSFVTGKPMRVATVAVGYGDGYRRHLSGNGAEVGIREQRCRVLGKVTMDQIMIDVDHLPEVVAGDEVLLFGSSGSKHPLVIPVEEVAEKAGTIPWEIFTGITPRVRRIYQSDQSERETG